MRSSATRASPAAVAMSPIMRCAPAFGPCAREGRAEAGCAAGEKDGLAGEG